MALDRQTIEKKDFPIGRRGYEPEAVDAHLAAIAEEVDALRRQLQRRGGESLAHAASVQVQAIVEAAETSAQEIERAAEEEAATIRQEAQQSAERTRQDALDRSQEHVGKVGEATGLMLQRVDAMESELGALVESLRTGANRLKADLSLLQGNMSELYAAAGREPEPEAAGTEAAPAPALTDLDEPEAGEGDLRAEGGAVSPETAAVAPEAVPPPAVPAEAAPPPAAPPPAVPASPEDAPPAQPAASVDEDVEGARLIALNMALNGQSREETDRYLAENFDLRDRAALLDDIYASVEG